MDAFRLAVCTITVLAVLISASLLTHELLAFVSEQRARRHTLVEYRNLSEEAVGPYFSGGGRGLCLTLALIGILSRGRVGA